MLLKWVVLTLSLTCAINCHQNHQQNTFQQPNQHHQQFQNQPNQQQFNQQQQVPPQAHHDGQNQMMNNINKDHVLEHLDGVINKPKDQMSVDEQNFYYFKLHDYDNNNMLDGLELVSAFAHNEGMLFLSFCRPLQDLEPNLN